MKIDIEGTVVFENEPFPDYLGDACAETCRLAVLQGYCHNLDLWAFLTPTGFVRHPDAPEIDAQGDSWRESDFTSDQALYLLMASIIHSRALFEVVVAKLESIGGTAPGKKSHPGVKFLMKKNYTLFALAEVFQMQVLNKIPWRWSDDGRLKDKWWKVTKREGSKILPDSTVEYMCSFMSMVFLHRVGVKWPLRFFNRDLYLQKTRQYYASKFNATWFVECFERYDFTR